jgi:small-conductance mechanosensitive channel
MRLPLLLALVGAGAVPLAAQAPAPRPGPALPVVHGGDTLLVLHAPSPPYTLEQRALVVSANVAQAIARARVGDSARIVSSSRGTYVELAGVSIAHALPADAAAEGTTPVLLAERWAAAIDGAVHAPKSRATADELLRGALRAALATLVALLAGWLLFTVTRRASGWVARWAARHVDDPRLSRAGALVSSEQLAAAAAGLVRVARLAGLLVLLYAWLVSVLGSFAWTQPVAGRVLRYVTSPLLGMARSVVAYLPSLIFIVLVVVALRLLLRFVRLVFQGIEQGTLAFEHFPPEWGDPTYKIVRALVIAFGLILVFPYLPGAGSDAFKAISLFAGALFSLGSSGAVANIVAGSVITYTRAFKVGDFVRIGDSEGVVVERSLLVTRLRTGLNVDVSIPSAAVLASHVQNFSAMAQQTGLVVQVKVTIGYDVPWRTVHGLLLDAAAATPGVREAPPPFVLQEALEDYYPAYVLHVYTDQSTGLAVKRLRSALHEHIQDRFFAAGVEILSPAYTALRDGNRAAIPDDCLPRDYEAPGFRMTRP